MVVVTAVYLSVQGNAPMHRHRFEEMLHQIGGELADGRGGPFCLEDGVGAAAEIERHKAERFIHRHIGVADTVDAFAVANSFVDRKTDVCIIPPNSFALARTVEYFRVPEDVLTICLGKSTYARCGIIVNVTPLEPEWEGHVTLEFSNTTTLPAKIYANEGVAQMLFFQSDEQCEVTYKDRGGKYQGQRGVTLPRT